MSGGATVAEALHLDHNVLLRQRAGTPRVGEICTFTPGKQEISPQSVHIK